MPPKPTDPRIGSAVALDTTHVTFDDGSVYRCEDGVIIAQLKPPTPPEK